MNSLYENIKYKNELLKVGFNKDYFNDKTFVITGASGMIGQYLIDTLLVDPGFNCKIYALVRNLEKAEIKFAYYSKDDRLSIVKCDVTDDKDIMKLNNQLENQKIDFVLHLASNTHPLAYSMQPISTITTNVIGTKNMLDFSDAHKNAKFFFSSSVEVYGKTLKKDDVFDENYCGYINSNTLRAGYPESKRVGEALCQAYIKEKNTNIIIGRLPRTFGPTMLMSDSKASSQFIKNGLNNENIVLKSEGNQFFSYCYVSDVVSAILFLLEKGINGEAYNISNSKCDVTLKEFAKAVADISKTKVIFDLPKDEEKKGFSTADKAILDSKKIELLGWRPNYAFLDAIKSTLELLK